MIAAVVTVALVPLSIRLSIGLGLLDRPDARKVHVQPTPRLGGVAMAGGMLVAGIGSLSYLAYAGNLLPPGIGLKLLAITGAGFFVFAVGLVDDVRTVSSRYKLVALLAASLMVCGSGATLGSVLAEWGPMIELRWLDWLVTMLWIAGVAVSVNFIDGLDGLAGGVTLIAAAVLAVFLAAAGEAAAAILPLVMCGALVGFLCFNWHPAKTFMGDSGSMTMGFLVASATVLANPLVGSMRGLVIPGLALSVPVADAVLTVVRRHYQQRRSIFSAEQGHIHHRLLARGMTHPQAVITIYLVSLAAVGIGLLSMQFVGIATLGGLSLVVPLLWGTFRLAGSIRTSEMLADIRRKRMIDRQSQQYRSGFEMLQLEFAHVHDFASWWQGVCRAADRLDFVSVDLPVPSRDGSTYDLAWTSTNEAYADGVDRAACMTASVPIADRRSGNDPLQAQVVIAANTSLESAGERLALFTRLMQEHSLRSLVGKSSKAHVAKRSSCSADAKTATLRREQCGPFGHLRVALVHDFYYVNGGAEKVIEQLIELFPHCDLFALFDFLPEDQRDFLRGKPVTTTLIQNLPFARTKHRGYLPLMPLAIEQLDVSRYDLVISSSYLAAKGVITGPDQLHICYCHSPVRYAWDLQHEYLANAGLGFGPKGMLARSILHYIRNWDARSSLGVDHFIANSRFVSQRIAKLYRRESTVVHAPADTDFFVPADVDRGDYYIALSRMVPYKRTDLIVEAFSKMPNRKLKVIGDGPEMNKCRRLAGPNIELLGHVDRREVRDLLQRAKGLVFAAEEDFGIVPLESLGCGTPVIAFGKGGVNDSVVPDRHGVLFNEQSAESLVAAIDRFETMDFTDEAVQADLRQQAERFGQEHFRGRLRGLIGQWVVQKWPERAAELTQLANENRQSKVSQDGDADREHDTPPPPVTTSPELNADG